MADELRDELRRSLLEPDETFRELVDHAQRLAVGHDRAVE